MKPNWLQNIRANLAERKTFFPPENEANTRLSCKVNMRSEHTMNDEQQRKKKKTKTEGNLLKNFHFVNWSE